MQTYYAIVEDNVDPKKLNMCAVRVFGKHTEDREIYPTSDLPWAPCLGLGAAISGESITFVPNIGDWVLVTFIDPEEQRPIILGTLPRHIVERPDFNIGFSDPNGVNPTSETVGEASISRLARNEKIDNTIIKEKRDSVVFGVDCAGTSWDEPETPYDAEYPDNKVIHTRKHIIELDDTDGKERIDLVHGPSLSGFEIHPDGSEIKNVRSKRFLIIDEDNNVLVKNNFNGRIERDKNESVGNDNNKDIVNDENKTIGKDENRNVGANSKIEVGGNKTNEVGGNKTDDVYGNSILNASIVTINADGSITIQGGGAVNIIGGGAVSISGPTISLN